MADKPDKAAILKQVEALQRGDSSAWDCFFKEYDGLIRSVVSWPKWHFDSHSQEDVAQNIRKELVKSISKFRGDSSLKYFVKRVCIHRIIDEIRRQVRKNKTIKPMIVHHQDGEELEIVAEAGEEFNPVQSVITFERAVALKKMMKDMDERCRTAVQEFYFEGLQYKEMAQKHGISINTVGARLSKCLAKLRTLMKKNKYFWEDAG